MELLRAVLCSLLCVSWAAASSQMYLYGSSTPPPASEAAYNTTDNLIFTTIASLLQQWPNTRYRNGHTIVKGTIPVGTTLYHARWDRNIPETPDWLATDVEHSLLICGPPECWMHTFSVKREINVVYFDGSSASNSIMGHQDSQDLVIYGKVRPDKVIAEWERIEKLCDWASNFGIDAIIRMEPGFEVMLCDFSKSLTLVSTLHIMAFNRPPSPSNFTNLSTLDLFYHRQVVRHSGLHGPTKDFAFHPPHLAPLKSHPPPDDPNLLNNPPKHSQPPPRPLRPLPDQPLPPNWRGPLRDRNLVFLEGVQAAGWNNFYPGEARVKLDHTRLISFYDPAFTSLVKAREGLPRSRHRLTNISRHDYDRAMGQLTDDLTRVDESKSGIDWGTLTRTVMDRYADRLYFLKELLSPQVVQRTNHTAAASRVREHLMTMLSPYLIYGALPSDADGRNISWVTPIYHQCASQLTARIPPEGLVRSEQMIKQAVEGVLQRICATLTNVWTEAFSVTDASEDLATKLLGSWKGQVNSLMQWLDWPVWDICRPACSEEMFCYIPMWPWAIPFDQPEIDMTPKCIDRMKGSLGTEPITEPEEP